MAQRILVLNAGSSSVKFATFAMRDDADPALELKGQVAGIGRDAARELSLRDPSARPGTLERADEGVGGSDLGARDLEEHAFERRDECRVGDAVAHEQPHQRPQRVQHGVENDLGPARHDRR